MPLAKIADFLRADVKVRMPSNTLLLCFGANSQTDRLRFCSLVGINCKVLYCSTGHIVADIHAFLDNMKAPLELVGHRTKYYKFIYLAVFELLGIPTSRPTFVKSSSFQLTKEYNLDNYRL